MPQPSFIPTPAPIFDRESELLVIGTMLCVSNNVMLEEWLAKLSADCFHEVDLQQTYTVICEVFSMGSTVDMISVSQHMRLEHPTWACNSINWAEVISHDHLGSIEAAIRVLRDFRVRRSLLQLSMKLQMAAQDTQASMAQTVQMALRELDHTDVSPTGHAISLHEVLPQLRQRLVDNQSPQTRHHGPVFGIRKLDDVSPMPETGLALICGGTSQGKSALAATIALASARQGMRSAYFSLELTNLSLASRMVAMEGNGTPAGAMLNKPLTESNFRDIIGRLEAIDRQYGEMIYFDDTRSSTLDDILSGIRYMVRHLGIRFAVVDFLQLLNYTALNSRMQTTTEQFMGRAARELKNLGDRLGILVIALCQINRSMEHQRPTLSVIRDSGQIAEACDYALFTWRPEAYHGYFDLDMKDVDPHNRVALLVGKNREGALSEVIAQWDGARTLVSELTEETAGQGGQVREGQLTLEY